MSDGIRNLLADTTIKNMLPNFFLHPTTYSCRMRLVIFTILMILLIPVLFSQAMASESPVEITSIFSDENSMDVTLHSSDLIKEGKIVFRLSQDNEVLEVHTMDMDMDIDTLTTKVIMWDSHFKFGTYTATARIYTNGKLIAEASDSFSYGFEVLPRFQIVDLSASSRGVNLLLTPRNMNPAVADFTFQLIHAGEIIYAEAKEDVPITQTTQISINWPILLEDHTDYVVRVKAFSHTPDIISSYVTGFSSGQDVEIDENDVDVDDFGVSVTLIGRSQVPYKGIVEVQLHQDSAQPIIFTGTPEILTLNRDDTVGIIWDDLDPGAYHVNILIKTLDGEVLDQYETMLLIPQRPTPSGQTTVPNTPGFSAFVAIIVIIALAAIIRKK